MPLPRYTGKDSVGTTIYNGKAWLRRNSDKDPWTLIIAHETHPVRWSLNCPAHLVDSLADRLLQAWKETWQENR